MYFLVLPGQFTRTLFLSLKCVGKFVAFGECRTSSCFSYKCFFAQVKTMRALQYFPTVEDPNTRRSLFEVIFCQELIISCGVIFYASIKPCTGGFRSYNGY